MKRFTTLVLLLALLITSIGPAATIYAKDAKTTISYYAFWCGGLDPGSYCEELLEDALDINIDVRKVSHTDAEAVNLMLASGDMPDCGWFAKTNAYMLKEELIRSIPVEMVAEYAPSYLELCERYPVLYALGLDPEDDSQFISLPDCSQANTDIYNDCIYIRYDWLQNLGIELEGIEIEQLTDQLFIADKGISRDTYTEIIRAFVNEDPDGNGKDDTFGLVKDWDTSLLSSESLTGGNMKLDDGVTMWYTHPDFKNILEYVRDIYEEGLVYPEIFTIGWGQDWELINTARAGVLNGASVATIWLNSWASNRPPLTLWAADPKSQLLMLPGIANEKGETLRTRNLSPSYGQSFFINADVDDKKLVEILKFLEYANFSDDQTTASLWFGEEGVDWEWEDGKPVRISSIINGDRGTQVFNRNIQVDTLFEWITFEPTYELGAHYYTQIYDGKWIKDLRYQYKHDFFMETKANDLLIEYNADWTNIRQEYFMAVILGQKNLESDWDKYINDLNKVKYDQYLNELNKAPNVADIIAKYSK